MRELRSEIHSAILQREQALIGDGLAEIEKIKASLEENGSTMLEDVKASIARVEEAIST